MILDYQGHSIYTEKQKFPNTWNNNNGTKSVTWNVDCCTVKQVIVNMLLTEKLFSFPVTLLHFVNLMNITNYSFNEAKSAVPGTSL